MSIDHECHECGFSSGKHEEGCIEGATVRIEELEDEVRKLREENSLLRVSLDSRGQAMTEVLKDLYNLRSVYAMAGDEVHAGFVFRLAKRYEAGEHLV